MIEYASDHRNRPIRSIRDYNVMMQCNRRKNRNNYLKIVGVAVLIAIHYCAYKVNEKRIEDKVQSRIELIIQEYENDIKSK